MEMVVPEPRFWRALVITLLSGFALLATRTLMLIALAATMPFDRELAEAGVAVSYLPGLLAKVAVVTLMLPASFGRAVGVTLLWLVIGSVVFFIPYFVVPALYGRLI